MIIVCQLYGSYLTSEYSDNQSMHSLRVAHSIWETSAGATDSTSPFRGSLPASLLGQPLA